MNIASTLAAYAGTQRHLGRAFLLAGSSAQRRRLTDARLLADQLLWAATTPSAADTAFNVVNGDVVRWRRLWPRLAAHLGVESQGPRELPQPLEQQMAGAEDVWAGLVAEHDLVEPALARVASWWHTDADLGPANARDEPAEPARCPPELPGSGPRPRLVGDGPGALRPRPRPVRGRQGGSDRGAGERAASDKDRAAAAAERADGESTVG